MKKTKTNGITLIVLIITIIVMLILLGVTINIIVQGRIISKAIFAAFAQEMQQIKEHVILKRATNVMQIANGELVELFEDKLNVDKIKIPDTLKKEILYTRDGYPSEKTTNDYKVEDFERLLDEERKCGKNIYS